MKPQPGACAALHLNAPAATSQRDSAARHTSKCSGRCSANVQQPGAAGGCSGRCSRAAARLTATGTRMWSWCDNRELLYQLQNRPRPRRPGARGCVVGLTRVAGPGSGAAPRPAGKLGPQPGTARRRCHASASLASAVPSVSIGWAAGPGGPGGAYSAAAPCNFTDADPAGAGIIRAAAGPSAAQLIRASLKPPPGRNGARPCADPGSCCWPQPPRVS
jgi:hypothetical protein